MKRIPIRHINSTHTEQISFEHFSIRKVQDLVKSEDLYQELHRHDFFFVLALQKGKGSHEIDFVSHSVLDNCIFFLRPGQVHQLELQVGCTGYLMEFNKELFYVKNRTSNQRLRKASNINFCLLDVQRFEKLNVALAYIFQEYTDKGEGYREMIEAYLDIFLIHFIRQSATRKGLSTNVNPYQQERLEEFIELLDKHINERKQVFHYTDMMNLSNYQLNEITKTLIGKTASEMITEQILLESKRYLLATPNQIKDIAAFLGYEDVSYFIRLFKKHTGYSPEIFRRNQS